MENKKKKTMLITICILSVANIFCFAIYHLSTFIVSSSAMIYVYIHFSELVSAVLPMITAASILTIYIKRSFAKSLLHAVPCVFTRILYLFPFHAFEYAYEGYEIASTLLLALLETFITLIVIYIESLLLFILIIFVTKIIAKFKGISSFDLSAALVEKDFLDFDKPLTVGIFSAACAVFVYNLTVEIIDTVNFLISYSGTYRVGEIFYILFRYIFILGVMIISHIITCYLKQRLS